MIGQFRHHMVITHSTNTIARNLIEKGAVEGTAVTAEFQTNGRGRMERSWLSDPGVNLLVSYILYPRRPMEEWGGLSLLAGVAVQEAVARQTGVAAHLKWPNDVMVGHKKLSGILVESGTLLGQGWVVVGIGVNVNQENFADVKERVPTSLRIESGSEHNVDALFKILSERLDAWYARWTELGNLPIIEEWKQRTRMLNREVIVNSGGSSERATPIDLTEDGCLLVRYEDGSENVISAGEVSIPSTMS